MTQKERPLGIRLGLARNWVLERYPSSVLFLLRQRKSLNTIPFEQTPINDALNNVFYPLTKDIVTYKKDSIGEIIGNGKKMGLSPSFINALILQDIARTEFIPKAFTSLKEYNYTNFMLWYDTSVALETVADIVLQSEDPSTSKNIPQEYIRLLRDDSSGLSLVKTIVKELKNPTENEKRLGRFTGIFEFLKEEFVAVGANFAERFYKETLTPLSPNPTSHP